MCVPNIIRIDRGLAKLVQKLQNAQLSQRDRAAGCVIVFAKSRRPGTAGRQYFTDIIDLSSTTVI